MTADIKIRFAKKEDVNEIIDLCEAHAHYEKAIYNRKGKVQQLEKDLFVKNPKLFCLVVESKNRLLGYATYMKQYATWDTCEYIYMDCLYIEEIARSLGIGEMVVRRIQEEGKKLNCKLIQWQTPDFNTRAIKFYNRIGSTSKSKQRFFLEI
ncbi:MAG: GNAT family N-acetyltransferase [Melioribacteraceae bacterium]